MHIPDGFLDPKLSGGLAGIAALVLSYCFSRVKQAVTAVVPEAVVATAGRGLQSIGLGAKRALTKFGGNLILKMGMVASLVFAAQMFNFPINNGTSGHLIGGVFSVVLLGPFAGSLALAAVLVVQSLFFSDGGLLALGANIVNMAVFGALLSYYIYAGLKKVLPERLAIMISAWLSVVAAAFICALEISFSGTVAFGAIVPAMFKIHAVIGVAEALITIALLDLFRQMMPVENDPQ